MGSRKKAENCLMLLAMVIASTASIPVDGNPPSEVVTLKSREDTTIRYRFLNNTLPHLYEINIEPNTNDNNFTWIGIFGIDIEVMKATPILTLVVHKKIAIDESFTELVDANGIKFKPIEQSRDDELESFKMRFNHELPVGVYSLKIKYKGVDSREDVGFRKNSIATKDHHRRERSVKFDLTDTNWTKGLSRKIIGYDLVNPFRRCGTPGVPPIPSHFLTFPANLLSLLEISTEIKKNECVDKIHPWFSHRISLLWWDDIWLSEDLSQYFQYYVMDEIHFGDSASSIISYGPHSVRVTQITRTDIRHLFGTAIYGESASIINMFRNVLTEDVFRAGMRKFLAKHGLGAPVADDLIRAFQEAHDEGVNAGGPLNVNVTVTPFLVQAGYPIVNVTRNYTTGVTEMIPEKLIGKNSIHDWWRSVKIASQTAPNFSSTTKLFTLRRDAEGRATITGIDKDDWIICNVEASYYYRFHYDDENWRRLVNYLNTDNYKNINVMDREQLINDAVYLVERQPERYFTMFYKLTKYLSREVEYLPWRAMLAVGARSDYFLNSTELQKKFRTYAMGLMTNVIEKVGYETRENDDILTTLLREDIVGWACVSGHSGCSDFAAKRLLKVLENPIENRLDPDTKKAIFCAGLRGLNDTAAKRVAEWALKNDKSLLIQSLGCTENHEIQRNFLISAMTSNSSEDRRDTYHGFARIVERGEENFNFALDFFLENHDAIKNAYNSKGLRYPSLNFVTAMCLAVRTKAQLQKFKQVLKLDALIQNKEYNVTSLLESAEKNLASRLEFSGKYIKAWNNMLSVDN